MLVWIDLETTGLDPAEDALLEVAVVLTDDDLNEVDAYESVVRQPDEAWRDRVADNTFVRDMHTANGLLEEVGRGGGAPIAHVEREVLDMLARNGAEGAPVAGSSVRLDRNFVDAHMPHLASALHYRTVDVSTVKELARRWAPAVLNTAPTPGSAGASHRAGDDIRNSIAELRHYRDNMVRVETVAVMA